MTPARTAQRPLLVVAGLDARLRAALAAAGYDALFSADAAEARRRAQVSRPGIVLLDLAMAGGDGLPLLADLRRAVPDAAIVAIAPAGNVARAVAAMRAGAQDVLTQPVEEAALVGALRTAAGAAPRPPAAGPAAVLPADRAAFIGSSEPMQRVHRVIASVARSQATVFITGESGTGKELAALAVHARSNRADGPFIALNCGAIPPDLLESEVFGHMKGSFTGAISDKPGAAAAADGGTLFLDEICEMALPLQTKMLRFLQTSTIQPVGAVKPRKVDVRIVCATNRDPFDAVRRGQFREDLFYRLYVVPVHMPPLRDRGSDILEIAEAALERFAAEEGKHFDGLAPETRRFLMAQDWPGNVRQLLNVMRNAVVLNEGGPVTPDMLPLAMAGTPLGFDPLRGEAETRPPRQVQDAPGLTLAEIERRAVEAALARHDGSVPRAARELDVSPSTLYRKLETWARRR